MSEIETSRCLDSFIPISNIVSHYIAMEWTR